MNPIEEYVNQFDGSRKEWILEYTEYMKKKHPEMEAIIWFRMPTYRLGCAYIAFSVTKFYFAIHTNEEESFQMLKTGLDKASFGKRSAKVKYSDEGAKHVIYNTIEFFAFKCKNGVNYDETENGESQETIKEKTIVIPFPQVEL